MTPSRSVSSLIRLAFRFALPAMRWFDTFVLAGTAGFAAAHGNGLPKIAGDSRLSTGFTASKRWQSASDFVHGSSSARREIDENTNTNGRCGKDFNNARCAPGYCCSVAGWCGKDKAYCWAPDCQIDFGPGCDGNKKPKGEDTSDVPRPKVGNVPYGGTGIYRCVNEGDIALTYDDGPFEYTGDLLDVFKSMLEDLGYHIAYFNLDTEGYLHDDPAEIQESKDIWDEHVEGSNPCNTSYLAIEHDLQQQVVYNLTNYMLKSLIDNGYRPVTVGECLGDPPENWYRAGKGEVPEYTYSPLMPTGPYSCLPDRASEMGTATSTAPTSSGDATSTNTPPTASSDEQASSSETNISSSAEGGENPEATGSAEPAGSTDATESTRPDSAANSPYSVRMAMYFVAVALSLCMMGA
ncbi:hypothetical protein DL764_005286 [Monosporascus ibericus]|uniref:Chitin-binding type-1 domain-containing protein n=1 Tax=Monosporascus ibericus TaxID=155417 RepID=A0A4V1XAM2_9PEZI|nr:hypothetical protein DL764_005286 [Monosporascus ibericus]